MLSCWWKQNKQYFSFLEHLVQGSHLYFLTLSFQIPVGTQMPTRQQVQRGPRSQMQNFNPALLFDDPVVSLFTTLNPVPVRGGVWASLRKRVLSGGFPSSICSPSLSLGSFSLHPTPQLCSCVSRALVFSETPFKSWWNSPVSAWFRGLTSGSPPWCQPLPSVYPSCTTPLQKD